MTRQVKVGPLLIGGNAPVSVQTMYDIPLSRLEEKFESRMGVLKAMGCDIIRFSYPDIKEHDALCDVVRMCPMPVVADIHFDYRNALDAMDCGVAKIRINPGNIGERWKTEEVVRKALDKGVAIRIGLNSGSLPHKGREKGTVSLMVDTALEYISWFEIMKEEGSLMVCANDSVCYLYHVKGDGKRVYLGKDKEDEIISLSKKTHYRKMLSAARIEKRIMRQHRV